MLSDYCVYTIRHTDDLCKAVARDCRGFTERRCWVQAEQLLKEAREQEKRMPIIFAPADKGDHLFGWALLEKITLDGSNTMYEFSGFQEFKPAQHRKSSLRKKSNGAPLSEQFIRPYAICKTPAYLR